MKRLLNIVLTAFAMLLVAGFAALLSLRVAIHGREVAVPALAGLSDEDAAQATRKLGLNLSVENRFFSASVPANHVLSQAPPQGERVRRGWQVRVTESLGAQHVAAPDLTGQSERPAALMLARLQLTAAPAAQLPLPGNDGTVVAQSPQPNSRDATEPRVALLVSVPLPEPEAPAYVMPRLVGLSVRSATTLLAGAGLHLTSLTSLDAAPDASPATAGMGAAPGSAVKPAGDLSSINGAGSVPGAEVEGASTNPVPPVRPAHLESSVALSDTVIAQNPAPGSRVTSADEIRITAAARNTPSNGESAAP